MLLMKMDCGLKWLFEYRKLLALLCGLNFWVKTLEHADVFGVTDAANLADG